MKKIDELEKIINDFIFDHFNELDIDTFSEIAARLNTILYCLLDLLSMPHTIKLMLLKDIHTELANALTIRMIEESHPAHKEK